MRVNVSGSDAKKIQARYGCSRTTAWRAARSGWLAPAYHERTVIACRSLDADAAEYLIDRAASAWRCIWHHCPPWLDRDDAVQEAAARLVELAGHPDWRHPPFALKVGIRAILGYIRRELSAHRVRQ